MHKLLLLYNIFNIYSLIMVIYVSHFFEIYQTPIVQ